MAKILIKRSAVPGKIPTFDNLDLGEISINTADGKMHIRKHLAGVDTLVEVGNAIQNLGFTPVNKDGDTLLGTIELASGSTTMAPIKFQQGVVQTTPSAHSLEWDGAFLYMTNNGSQRKTVAYTDSNSTGTNAGWTTARTLTFTGDANGAVSINGTSNVSAALSLQAINNDPGIHGDAKTVPIITVNTKGLVTAISSTPIALTTSDVPEGTNKYYYDSRARAAISVSGSLSYNSATGVISYTAPSYATVATTGSYTDLTNQPVIHTTTSSTGLTQVAVCTIPTTSARVVKLVIAIADTVNAKYQATELLIMHDGAGTYMTEYATISNAETLGIFDASITGGNLVVNFTPITSPNKRITTTRILVLI